MKEASRGFVKAVIIVAVLFSIIYFFSYKRWISKDFGSEEIKYNYNVGEKNNEDVVEVKKNSMSYLNLYNSVNYEFLENNFGEEFFDIYYNNQKFNDNFYTFVGIINLINKDLLINCNYDKILSLAQVDSSINSIFGNVKYNNISFKTKNGHLSIDYDNDLKGYHVVTDACSGFDFSNGGIKTEYYETFSSNDYLYIDEKALYMEYSLDINGKFSFNYHSGITKNDKILSNKYEEIDKSKIPTYRLIFKNIDGNYYFDSVEKK